METAGLREKYFWESQSCHILSPPGREVESEEIRDALGKREGVVFATSGSCGPPKWVLFRRKALLASARAVNEHLAVSANDRFLVALPQYHVGGFGMFARAYDAGCPITTMEGRWNPSGFRETIEKDGSTVTSLVPTQIHDLVRRKLKSPQSLRVVVVGGGRMNEAEGTLARELGWPVLQSYGMTEAGSQIATATLESLEEPFRASCLPILPIWKSRISGDGCLEFKGAALCECYIERQGGEISDREAVSEDGWFCSRDRVRLSGNLVTVSGRADRAVKILGELVDVEAREREIRDCLKFEEIYLLTLPDSRKGARLELVIADSFNGSANVLEEINGKRGGLLRIDGIRSVRCLPRTSMGKVDALALRKQLGVDDQTLSE